MILKAEHFCQNSRLKGQDTSRNINQNISFSFISLYDADSTTPIEWLLSTQFLHLFSQSVLSINLWGRHYFFHFTYKKIGVHMLGILIQCQINSRWKAAESDSKSNVCPLWHAIFQTEYADLTIVFLMFKELLPNPLTLYVFQFRGSYQLERLIFQKYFCPHRGMEFWSSWPFSGDAINTWVRPCYFRQTDSVFQIARLYFLSIWHFWETCFLVLGLKIRIQAQVSYKLRQRFVDESVDYRCCFFSCIHAHSHIESNLATYG